MESKNPHSTASIAGHPIHPMLVPFPIAFFVAAFACDLIFWNTGGVGWGVAALWLLGAGLLTAALAAIAGLIDVFGDKRIRDLQTAWLHAGGNIVVVLIQLYNWYYRYANGVEAAAPAGTVLSLLAVALLLFTGWMGGELVFRHRVGVRDARLPPAE